MSYSKKKLCLNKIGHQIIKSTKIDNNIKQKKYNLRSNKNDIKYMISPYINSLNILKGCIGKELKKSINKNYNSNNELINYSYNLKQMIINNNQYDIYAFNSTTIIEIADYDKYHEFKLKLNSSAKINFYLQNLINDFTNISKNKVIIIWFLKYLTNYYPILISEYENNECKEKWLYDISTKIDNTWISASKTRNYLMDDPLIDYLEYNQIYDINDIKDTDNYKKRKYSDFSQDYNKPTFKSTILNNGIEFEDKIIEDLKKKYPDKIVKILDISIYNEITKLKLKDPIYSYMTINMINKGIPIIYQGVLHNKKNKSYGLPDMIIRADYINKIFHEKIDINMVKLKTTKQYPYYIIDIKNSNIHLSAKNDTILNYNGIKSYKGQITIYHQILSDIQKHDTEKSFIMASKWTRTKKNIIYQCYNPFDRLGIIDFASNDISYIDLSSAAIEWNKLIRKPNNKLNCLEPNNYNLYPNMCNTTNEKFTKVKRFLATKNHEITDIWMCGPKHRTNAILNGCTKWSDNNLDSKILGFNGKNANTLDLILKINKSKSNKLYDKFYPNKIKSTLNGWRDRDKLSFYIDFETLNTTSFIQRNITDIEINHPNDNDIIFMIGIGYSFKNEWEYKCFTVDDLTNQSQIKIINNMTTYIKDISDNYYLDPLNVNIFHWSNFEPLIFRKTCFKYNIIMPIFKWTDILKMFHEEPIIIKGALNFSLKSVGRALYELNMIKTIWLESDNVKNGLDAMFQAYMIYNNPDKTNFKVEMKSIQIYNEIDCKIMWEILNALSKYF
jgi:hypothetical protein